MFYPANKEWIDKWIEVLHQAVKKGFMDQDELNYCLQQGGISDDIIDKIKARTDSWIKSNSKDRSVMALPEIIYPNAGKEYDFVKNIIQVRLQGYITFDEAKHCLKTRSISRELYTTIQLRIESGPFAAVASLKCLADRSKIKSEVSNYLKEFNLCN